MHLSLIPVDDERELWYVPVIDAVAAYFSASSPFAPMALVFAQAIR